MDGIHDMGGMDGFGKVDPEPNEPVFHQRWEGRVMAMSRAIGASVHGISIRAVMASSCFRRMSISPAPTTRDGFCAPCRCSFSAGSSKPAKWLLDTACVPAKA